MNMMDLYADACVARGWHRVWEQENGNTMIQKFLRDGWVIADIPEPNIIYDIINYLNRMACYPIHLIHESYREDDAAKRIHISLSKLFWKREYSLKISHAILPLLKQLIGMDIMVQYYPYLRVARPNKPQDNIGYHKDTQYGQTPFELTAHIPFVDVDEKSAMRIIGGSHRFPENMFPRKAGKAEARTAMEHRMGKPDEVKRLFDPSTQPKADKGSIEWKTGRPYAPKFLSEPFGYPSEPLVMKIGQVAFFCPALFHGQEVNEGSITRVSTDIRFVNSFVPIKAPKGKVDTGYVPVSESPITKIAKEYYEVNPL